MYAIHSCHEGGATTLSCFAKLGKQSGADGGRFRIVFVLVDPGYANPANIGRHAKLFGTPNLGLTATAAEVDVAVKAFRAFGQKVPANDGGDTTIGHTASVYLMDASGRLQSIIANDDTNLTALARLKRLVG